MSLQSLRNYLKEIENTFCINRAQGIDKICLFLDFDGVINTFLQEDTERFEMSRKNPEQFEFCDANCIQNLNILCRKRNIDIVISSTWRFSGVEFCKAYLKNHNFLYCDRIIGTTQMNWENSREEEIVHYLFEHPVYATFFILDDMKMPELENYLIQTNSFIGFDENALHVALKITADVACKHLHTSL